MQTIFSVVFSNRRKLTLLGKLIMKIEGTRYSHASVMTKLEGEFFIYEAVWPMPRQIRYIDWIKTNEIIEEYTLPPVKSEVTSVAYLHKLIDDAQGYSIAQLFLNAIGLINKNLNKWAGTVILNHEKYLVCTELVGRFLEDSYNYDFHEHEDSIDLLDVATAVRKILNG